MSISEITSLTHILDPLWAEKLHNREITESQLDEAFRNYNNVVREIRMVLRVIK